ncbi:hypothetical protein DEW08_12735 [Azospirillum thermophilum]|uniref:Uncharacterized protein n=1 Tax=Azospirillum thermophilum TaxID=2202148 RepID=A0A2S2CUF1_9PROT|nr:hypothetical protein DEW08_12735 [Azospirillum thermophilum]
MRDSGFPEARVSIAGIGLDGARLRLDSLVAFGALGPAGERYGLALAGRGTLSGPLLIGLTPEGVVASPLGCLEGSVEGLEVAGEAVAAPQGLRVCTPAAGEVLRWGSAGLRLAARIESPRIELTGRRILAEGVEADLAQDAAAQAADLRVASLRPTGKPADFAPLALAVRAEQPAGQAIALTATVTGADGVLSAGGEGRHDPASGEGRFVLTAKPIRLKPGGPGLGALSPRLAALVDEAAGTIGGSATFAWTGKGLRSGAQVKLAGVTGRVGPVTVAAASGTIALTSLLPPEVPAGQILKIGLLDVGVPLTDGTVRFGYGRDGRLSIEEAQWHWAGGLLRSDPVAFRPEAPKGAVTLHAEGVDLARLFAMIDVDGLEASGRLGGSLPVTLAGDVVRVDGGILESAGPGTLRYDPEKPPSALQGDPGSPTGMLLGALTDFRYESLRLTVDGQAGGELSVGVAVRGANPAFYDGYPVALNLKLSGALDRILRQSLDAARIPDAVREGMTDFGRKDR